MKPQILLLAIFTSVLVSCNTAYKTGQTPDDVYYSPQRPQDEYVRVDDRRSGKYYSEDEYYDDRYLRMKVRNRYRWNELQDWYYFDRYSFGYNYYYGSYYNPYNSWNYYYNPYCPRTVVVVNPKSTAATNPIKLRNITLNSYTNTNYNNNNSVSKLPGSSKVNRPGERNYNNQNNSLSNKINNWFSGNNSNSRYSNTNSSSNSGSESRPTRTYTPSSGNSSGSSGSNNSGGSSGGGSVSRPSRGGK